MLQKILEVTYAYSFTSSTRQKDDVVHDVDEETHFQWRKLLHETVFENMPFFPFTYRCKDIYKWRHWSEFENYWNRPAQGWWWWSMSGAIRLDLVGNKYKYFSFILSVIFLYLQSHLTPFTSVGWKFWGRASTLRPGKASVEGCDAIVWTHMDSPSNYSSETKPVPHQSKWSRNTIHQRRFVPTRELEKASVCMSTSLLALRSLRTMGKK